MANKKDYLGGFIYYSDILIAIVLWFFFFTGLYGIHLLNPVNFKHYILGSGHLIYKAFFIFFAIPFLLYLYFIPYALWRKSKKEGWISRICCNGGAYVLIALVLFYTAVYWTGHWGQFSSINSDLGMVTGGFFLVFALFTAGFAFEASFEIYITHPIMYQIWEEMRMEEMERKAKAKKKKAQQQKQQSKPQNAPEPQPKQNVQMEVKERLKRLKELLDEGLISEEDYKRKKEDILKEL